MNKDDKKGSKEGENCDPGSLFVSSTDFHFTARPMKVVRDRFGRLWLCRPDVDEDGDLEAQGGWRCGNLAFSDIG